MNVMQTIWQEIQEVKEGKADKEDNVLLNAPHPEYEVVANEWNHSYSREKAAYPIETVRENKFWINVARVDNTLGDRKLLPTRYGKFEEISPNYRRLQSAAYNKIKQPMSKSVSE